MRVGSDGGESTASETSTSSAESVGDHDTSAAAESTTGSSNEGGSESGTDAPSGSSGSTATGAPAECGNGIVEVGEYCHDVGPETEGAGGSLVADLYLRDLDGDTELDAIVATLAGEIWTFAGDGSGSFAAPVSLATISGGIAMSGLAVADLDDDGAPEILALTLGGDLVVLTRAGLGPFSASGTFSVAVGANDLRVVDLDADGIVDVAATSWGGGGLPGALVVLDGLGASTFGTAQVYAGAFAGKDLDFVAWGLTSGDFDGDGLVDIAFANVNGGGRIEFFRGSEDGELVYGRTIEEESVPFGVLAADLDGDGDDELIVSREGASMGEGVVKVYETTPALAFEDVAEWETNLTPRTLEAADLDADGEPEIIVGHEGFQEVSVMSVDGAGGYVELADHATGNATGLVVDDVDGDAVPDIVVAANATGAWKIATVLSNP